MLDPLDEYPIHQTPAPVTENDLGANAYDRYFFNGYDDGSVFVGVALGIYPNRRVIDAAFCLMIDGVQHSVFASARMGQDRRRTAVGPITLGIDDPMRTMLITVDHPEIAAELRFEARTPPIEEPRFRNMDLPIGSFDYTRYTQFGRWDGQARVGADDVQLDGLLGCRDRSWGHRGGRGPDAAPSTPSFHWLWTPINLLDGAIHLDVNEYTDGRRWHHGGFRAPLLEPEGPPPWTCPVETMASVDYRLVLEPGTRWAAEAELTFQPYRAEPFTVRLEPLARFQMSGIGYGHARFRHGTWRGEDVVDTERIRVADIDPTGIGNFHVQHIVRAERSDGGAPGIGVLELLIVGPHEPMGFSGLDDVASAPPAA